MSTVDATSRSPAPTGGEAAGQATATVLRPDQANVVVLAADPALLEQVRAAIDGRHRIWRAESATHAAELVFASNHGVLLLDTAVTGLETAEVVNRLRQQLPELQIVVTGRRDDESGLAALISSGDVYRFLHKPVSPERARTFIDGAVRRQQTQANPAAHESRPNAESGTFRRPAQVEKPSHVGADRRRVTTARIAGAAAAALVTAAASWIALRPTPSDRAVPAAPAESRQPTASPVQSARDRLLAEAEAALDSGRLAEPRGNNAIELFRQVLRHSPSDATARQGLFRAGEALLDRAEQALLIGDLLTAATMLDAARFAEPAVDRLQSLRRNLDVERARLNEKPPAGTIHALEPGIVPQIGQQEARALLGRATQRIASGNLVEGPQSAAALLNAARQENPSDPAIGTAQDRLSDVLVQRAREALAAGRYSDTARWIREVETLGRDATNATRLRTDLSSAQALKIRDENARLLELARQRIAQDRLVEPEADSAQHYIDLLRAADGAFPGLSETIQALIRGLLDLAREQTQQRQWFAAERSVRAASALGADPAAVRQAGDALERVRSADRQPQLTAESALRKIQHIAAKYPSRAARTGVEGSVEVEFTIGADGATRDATIVSSTPPAVFDRAATDAVAQWRYQPLEVDGIAIPARTRVRLRFKQSDR